MCHYLSLIISSSDFGYDDGEDLYEAVGADQLIADDTPPAVPGLPPSMSRPSIQPTAEGRPLKACAGHATSIYMHTH